MKFGLAPTTCKMCIGSLTPTVDRNILDPLQKRIRGSCSSEWSLLQSIAARAIPSVAALRRFGGIMSFSWAGLINALPGRRKETIGMKRSRVLYRVASDVTAPGVTAYAERARDSLNAAHTLCQVRLTRLNARKTSIVRGPWCKVVPAAETGRRFGLREPPSNSFLLRRSRPLTRIPDRGEFSQ